jgi:hypothetical protein
MKGSTTLQMLDWSSVPKIISRKVIPIVVGGEDNHINALRVSQFSGVVSFGGLDPKSSHDYRDYTVDLSLPELGYNHTNNNLNTYYVTLPYGTDTSTKVLRVLLRKGDNIVYQSFFPVERYKLNHNRDEEDPQAYNWRLTFPDADFYPRAERYRVK